MPFVVRHSSINFTSTLILHLCLTLTSKLPIFHHIVLPADILWLSFDSITTSFGSLLSRWLRGYVTKFILRQIFDTTIFLPSYHNLKQSMYTILSHLRYHLKLLKKIDSTFPSSLMTDATDKVSSTSASSLVTDVVPTLTNGYLRTLI